MKPFIETLFAVCFDKSLFIVLLKSKFSFLVNVFIACQCFRCFVHQFTYSNDYVHSFEFVCSVGSYAKECLSIKFCSVVVCH